MRASDEDDRPVGVERGRVGQLIRQRRMLLGLTQEEAADRAGVSVGSWRSTEAGTRRPRPHTFAAVLEAIDLTPEQIHEVVGPDDPSADIQQLLHLIQDELPDVLAAPVLLLVRLAIAGHELTASRTVWLPELAERPSP